MKHDPNFEKVVDDARTRIEETTVPVIHERLEKGETFLLIDVREKDEWDNGHIPKAVHVGKGVIERDIHQVAERMDQEIVLYCGGGYRSALAADNLKKMGYTNVISMDGGMRGWKEAGFKVEVD
jgi:rhodanese-related sulfurtransferase